MLFENKGVWQEKTGECYGIYNTKVIVSKSPCRRWELLVWVLCGIQTIDLWTQVLLTNNFDLEARTIGDIHKSSWQIEYFFKILKQNFKIKSFSGTSKNAVKIQVWTALIAILMTKYLKFLSKAKWHFSTLVTCVKWNLFVYRDLRQWLDHPFTKPPAPVSFQPEFSF